MVNRVSKDDGGHYGRVCFKRPDPLVNKLEALRSLAMAGWVGLGPNEVTYLPFDRSYLPCYYIIRCKL
jgi:hypothetical protein